MQPDTIFALQLFLSTVAFAVVARALVSPRLRALSKREALLWLTVPHVFRHVGMVFLVPGVVDRPLPPGFALPAAYGDLLTGLLALAAFTALHAGGRFHLGLVWLYNLVGVADLARALPHTEVVSMFGSAWYIPTMLVPLLLVTHAMSFGRLLRAESEPASERSGCRPEVAAGAES